MKLSEQMSLPPPGDPGFMTNLRDRLRAIVQQLNLLQVTESSVVPTWTGTPGEYVVKTPSAITEAGTTPNKYTVVGWRYVGSAWVEQRMFTGT